MNNILGNNDFNPSGIGLKNANFIGLPFNEESANVLLIPVPWDVTVSYRDGTALAPQVILDASVQLDLFDTDVKDAWKLGIFMQPLNAEIMAKRNNLRPKALGYIDFLETGGAIHESLEMKRVLDEINAECQNMNNWVFNQAKKLLAKGKLVGIVGGDHSVPLGLLRAISEKYNDFGVLQIDAHLDLRDTYEGFEYSHASIFYNALKIKEIRKLVQVGIRDYCEEEVEKVKNENDRIDVFYDHQIKDNRFCGVTWGAQCAEIIDNLPENVYVSFDIDGLNPSLCPNTGTPVPGGLEFPEIIFLLKELMKSGRKIVGFDLCEVGNKEWDGNVGARILYKLCNLMGKTAGKI